MKLRNILAITAIVPFIFGVLSDEIFWQYILCGGSGLVFALSSWLDRRDAINELIALYLKKCKSKIHDQ